MRQYKIVIVSMVLMISALSLFGQKTAAVVTVKNVNVLYAGIPNSVSIESSVSPEKLFISWGGAIAKEIGNREYEVDVPASLAGKEIIISISEKLENGEMQQIGSSTFRIKPVPEPTIVIGEDVNSGKQGKDVLLASPFVSVKMPPDFIYELNWQVVSYSVTFVRNGTEEATISVNGAKFNEKVIEKIRNAPSGTIVEFSDIRIQSNIAGSRTIVRPLAVRLR